MEQIEFDYTQPINDEWKKIMEKHLRTAKTFEIHCWNEETTWIEYALKYGTLKNDDWQYGKIIVGLVSTDFVNMVLQLPKPKDTEIYNKMTPSFSIFLDNGFSSEHYGTELNQQ